MVVILMGVSGSGKTTIGAKLAEDLGWRFLDADDFHPPENVRRMAAGHPLTEEDRKPWLARLREAITAAVAAGENLTLACSALSHDSRHQLVVDAAAVRLVYLKGEMALIRQRLRNRSGHFMKEDMLASQFAALEEPTDALVVDIDDRPATIVQKIRDGLGL
ncbi:MAG TPA: gluconokinase [Polyangia bacterium]|jgi:gluconokinase